MLLFMDGQKHYDPSIAGLQMKYTSFGAGSATWTVVPEGRLGNCIKTQSNSNNGSGFLAIAPLTTRLGAWAPSAGSGGVLGFAIKVTNLANIVSSIFIVSEGPQAHLRLEVDGAGTFRLIRYRGNEGGSGPDVIAVSSEGLTENTWQFVEFKWVIHVSAGMFEVRVGGITVLTFSGRTVTTAFGSGSLSMWTSVTLLAFASQFTPGTFLLTRMCDLYLCDLVSADSDDVSDFLGDGTILTIRPNGVGGNTDWTPNVDVNWDNCNDTPPDGDTTYVVAQSIGAQDTYQFEDIPVAAIVKGAQVCILARKELDGGASLAPIVRQGSTNYVGPTQAIASINYDRFLTQAWDLNPATMGKFTPAEINAGQFGTKKVL